MIKQLRSIVTFRSQIAVALFIALLLPSSALAQPSRVNSQSNKPVITTLYPPGKDFNQTLNSADKTTLTHLKTAPTVERLSGSNAINTSIAVSQKYYGTNVPVAYVVNRSGYADGIVAGAMKTAGPILYVDAGSLSTAVANELQRLNPQKVIVIGGTTVVSENVFTQIQNNIPSDSIVERLSGPSRYETAVSVSRSEFSQGSDVVYVTNGTAYADAIAATQQSTQGPLLYTLKDTVFTVVTDEINRLGASQVVVVGGTAVVGEAAVQTIAQRTGANVTRVSGSDRYVTNAEFSKQLYPNGIDQVYIANGYAYADSILVSSIPTPGSMLYVEGTMPNSIMTELQRLDANKTTIIGGTVRVPASIETKASQIMRGSQVIDRVSEGVSYFALAHPDDELASWAVTSASAYPVFILTTQGENSGYCDTAGGGYGGRGSQQCKDHRMSSWHKFLDNYFTVDDQGMQPGGFHLYIGADSARLVFDYGDGNLTTQEVTEAINLARQVDYGIATENYVASGNYWNNGQDPSCPAGKTPYQCGHYDHPDHRAVYQAVTDYSHPNKFTFHGSYNPTVNAGVTMDRVLFDSMIACPNGTYNQAYSWLNPPCWTRENSRWDHWQWMLEY